MANILSASTIYIHCRRIPFHLPFIHTHTHTHTKYYRYITFYTFHYAHRGGLEFQHLENFRVAFYERDFLREKIVKKILLINSLVMFFTLTLSHLLSDFSYRKIILTISTRNYSIHI